MLRANSIPGRPSLRHRCRVPFPQRRQASTVFEDPEALYRALAETNNGPPALWVHQGEVLRTWHSGHQDTSDVAIELPTGAGKTLVGGLIAEFRRRVHGERAAIACPTRQLARQTAARLSDYGIPNVLLVGKVRTWDSAARASYTRGEAIAVTVYSHIFNSNPAIDDAEILLFDDAHAAEQPVSSPWALNVARETPVYGELLSLLADALDPLVIARLRNDGLDPHQRSMTYLASPRGVAANAAAVEAALASAVVNKSVPDGVGYTLATVQGHLDRALVYVSHRSILIRPLIAPTSTHAAFAGPRQRVYMSATLGHGGELERGFGRPWIARIAVPKGWDRQGSGRRFFAFPAVTTDLRDDEDVDAWVRRFIGVTGRALVLAPSDLQAKDLIERIVPSHSSVLRAEDVEDDLAAFTTTARAALVLANRYDGIDLPDGDCRLVVLAGLPSRGDLQERFLHDSLGAVEVLRERVRARFAQGSGRATRNVKDYAAVVVLGDELINYVTKREVVAALHPELQAELAWGFDESRANTGDGLLADLGEFLEQTPTWHDANADIIARRQEVEVVSPPGTDVLANAAPFEVEAWEAAWHGDWERATGKARRVIDELRGGREVQRYAALWYYLLATWLPRTSTASPDAVTDFMERARAAGRGTTWLDHLAAPADRPGQSPNSVPKDEADLAAIEQVLNTLPSIGRNASFEQMVTESRSCLLGADAPTYEDGLVRLGELAGAVSEGNGRATAAPDAMWRFNDKVWISWEAKSDASPDGELGANDVREAGSHLRFMQSKYGEEAPRASYGLIVTPQARVHPAAMAIAEDHLYRTRPATVVKIFDRLVRAWRKLRSTGTTDAEGAWEVFRAETALPSQWRELLQVDPLVTREE